jgi:hypothetical protein
MHNFNNVAAVYLISSLICQRHTRRSLLQPLQAEFIAQTLSRFRSRPALSENTVQLTRNRPGQPFFDKASHHIDCLPCLIFANTDPLGNFPD